ncbi:hypothetical protein VTJ04DRAFT_1137 [Mycothermus thermophilus]|uniref:uncharacterized protein n=1 Tax=Humicola insolens TaxID=85995 RepID=UPI00374339AB
MGLSSGSRTGVVNGASPSLLSSPPRRSPRTSLTNSSKPLSPSVSVSSSDSDTSSHKQRVLFDSASRRASSEAIAPEIVVCTEKMDTTAMEVTPTTDTPRGEEQAAATPAAATSSPLSPPPPSPMALSDPPSAPAPPAQTSSSLSSLSSLSDASERSSAPASGSSKATTPVDIDSSKEVSSASDITRPTQPPESPRRKWDIRPRVSIPNDLPLPEYAMQCVAAAEASRLNPYALHQEEYLMLRGHISHAQVTTYLNIRNGILRLWIRNPQIPVTREEAVGCAKDWRWFDVASLCFDWLVRRGYINFGCLEVRSPKKSGKAAPNDAQPQGRRRTVVVIGAGMSGLGCARQLEGLFLQYAKKFRSMGEEPPRVIVLEGRNRVGGRVYSRAFKTKPKHIPPGFEGKRFTAEMGGMIITGFERGNPMNILLRAQLGLGYHLLVPETTLYDANGKPVDLRRDQLVENLYNDCLDRVSEYKFKPPTSKLIEGNRDLIDEGKDSSVETHKTIRQTEELSAAQPHAAPVSEQNLAPQVNLVPVSSDKATGKIHVAPGTPGAVKAAQKAKMMGWTLKHGVSDDADLDLETPAKEPGATLGSVTDRAIAQYRDLLDLTPQDFRLMNWHIANLEYSNATNYHQLSLQGWDIDAGNEWEGSHSMVVGGYQSVPRGLLYLPTPLDVRQKSPVCKISYSPDGQNGLAVVECEDGFKVEADYVVNTIPLGVLKHGNVKFDPPLPAWKQEAIDRLGFGVLNKVILVYREPFWDESRDIFGVLRNPTNRHSLEQKDYATNRGRFFQWFNATRTSGMPTLIALMAGDAGFDTEQTCNDELVAEATAVLRSVYGSRVPHPVEAIVTRWASDKFARGSYSSAGPDMKADDYDTMARPIGNLYFAGEHTCGTHPATVHGAYLSGLRAASEVLDAMLGPIPVPTPLILPKDAYSSGSVLGKRKAGSSVAQPQQHQQQQQPQQQQQQQKPQTSRRKLTPLQEWEDRLWEHLITQLGPRPLPPPKPATNAYIFYSKAHYEDARRRLEANRRPGRGKPSANEVRVMSAKMWRDASDEDKKPFVEMAEEMKKKFAEAMERWKEEAAEWDRKAEVLRGEWERAGNPMPGGTGRATSGKGADEVTMTTTTAAAVVVVGVGTPTGEEAATTTTTPVEVEVEGRRRSKSRVESYREVDSEEEDGDEEMEEDQEEEEEDDGEGGEEHVGGEEMDVDE